MFMRKEKIYQNKFINTLMLFDTKKVGSRQVRTGMGYEQEYKIDEDLYVFTSVPKNYEGKYTIDDFIFGVTTKRLLLFLIMKFTNLSEADREVGQIEFTVREFMELCNLKNSDNTKRLIEKDLFNLFCIRAEFQGQELFLLEDIGIGRGKFVVILHESFTSYMMAKKGIVLLPCQYFEIAINRSCEAPGWLYFLVCQSLINSRHTNKNRISVNSLLVRSSLMGINEIRQTSNCSVKERVITPLTKNLQAISESVEMKYFSKSGKELNERQLLNMGYDELIKVIIHFEIK